MLHHACSEGHLDLVTLLLLDHRFHPQIADEAGCRALHLAAFAGHEKVVRLLLADPRVDPFAKDHFNIPAIDYARASPNSKGIAKIFEEHCLSLDT